MNNRTGLEYMYNQNCQTEHILTSKLLKQYLQIVPKKLQSALGYRLRKNPLWNLKNQTRLWNYDYFSTIRWRPDLIWPSSRKEIWKKKKSW